MYSTLQSKCWTPTFAQTGCNADTLMPSAKSWQGQPNISFIILPLQLLSKPQSKVTSIRIAPYAYLREMQDF